MIKVGLDIGNSKISSVVCDVRADGSKKVLSFISRPTNNLKKSTIINLELLRNEISKIISEAEKESETTIKSIILNIPAVESLSVFTNSEIKINNEKINDLHLKKAINESNLMDPIEDYQTIQNLLIGYKLDNKILSSDPIGNYGNNLEVNFYKFAVKKNFTKTLTSLFNNLEINIENFVPTPLSSALSILNQDDMSLGAICIDLGAGSSSISLFENEKLIYMDSINIGGNNITNDIARGIPTTIDSAERLKTLYGSVISSPSDENELIEVPIIGDDFSKSKQINRSTVNLIIKPRVEENLELLRQKLKEYDLHRKYIKNLVLTGGGSLLEGIADYAQIIFDSNVRLGKPKFIQGIKNEFLKPQFSQTLGTILFEKNQFEIKYLKKKEKIKKNDVLSRFSSWLDKYI